MMNVKQFHTLKAGTVVQWREWADSPRAGEITENGVVVIQDGRHFVRWPDGQETDGRDDWALLCVEVRDERARA